MIKIFTFNINYENQSLLRNLLEKAFTESTLFFEPVQVDSINITNKELIDTDVILIGISNEDKYLLSLCRKLKKQIISKHIPIVFLLEKNENKKFHKKYLKAGCDGLLMWPFDKYKLKILMNSMLKIKENNVKRCIENDLRVEKERADNIIEGINAGTWDWNIETDEMIINSRWAEILGYSLEELQPVTINTWKNLVHTKDLKVAQYKINGHFKQKMKYYYAEFRMRHKNGNWVWINSRGKIVEYSDKRKPLRMAGTHIDITHKKSAEKELVRAKEKAVESDRLKSAFLSNMSHEIRTPMNGILGFIDLLKNPELNSETQSYYIDIVKKSGERLLNTINDIIELSKIEAGESSFHFTNTNIDELMHFFSVFFSPQTKEKGIELKYSSDPSNKNVIVKTDRIKLESILTNLIKNALKFTSQGIIEFGFSIENEKLLFYVKDTGKGIQEDKLDIIFERFVQANTKINRGHEGSGLGLSIAKAYAKMLGGDIWVESEINKGSTFHFTINYEPIIAKKQTAVVEKQTEIPKIDYSKFEIIVAEDEEVNFMLIEQFLSLIKIKLIHAQNGEEVIQICKTNPNISLILMDIKMPVMDGFVAAKHIRKLRPNIPMIAQTAYALTHEVQKYKEFFDDYITKPINRVELKEKILKYLS